jgi:hypothetical protein
MSSAALASEEGGAVGSSIGATGEGDIATGGTGRGNGEELVDMALDLWANGRGRGGAGAGLANW